MVRKPLKSKRHHVFLVPRGMDYQSDHTVKEIEDQLFLIYTKDLPKQLTYEELMGRPRLLKRNYFDF